MLCRTRAGVGLLLLLTSLTRAGEIGYSEDFALARDREAVLKTLIPGSEDYYYYYALYYQQTRQFEKVDELLKLWVGRYQDSPRLREIQNRQALLTYETRPQQTLDFLRQRLDLRFDHQREALGTRPDLPTQLDPALIRRDRLAETAFQRHPNLAGFEDAAFAWLLDRQLNVQQRRHLLERVNRPDWPGLLPLIAVELGEPASKPFGALPIHQQLLREQLDELRKLKPDLLNQPGFVNVYLIRLRPNDDVDLAYERDEREAYLERLWAFVSQLTPAHNSLKAHVLYHHLVHDRSQGVFDKQRFLDYIQLPRPAAYVQPRWLETAANRLFPADLNAEFAASTGLPPVGNDEPLVRSYLQHFFLTEDSIEAYEPFLRSDYLREVLAETKILHGLGEPEQWYSLLPADKYQALKDRVDLEFAATNPLYFTADQPVALDVHVKNVNTLIVKVFEINTKSFYRQQQREVNSDINLDGLVANEEQTYRYTEPPLRRVSRRFEFPKLTRPGVYVIDLIGNGVSSRAVVRKGKLTHVVRNSTAGHVFTVFDDQHRPLADARLWLAGHEYPPDAAGQIVVPYTANSGRQAIVLTHGEFSSLDHFQHETENYALATGFYVAREALLANRKARVLVRAALHVNGTPVTLSVLEDVRLVITSTDRDGVSTTKEVPDFKLYEDRESTYEFQVPPRLAQIQFSLVARVQNLSQNKKLDLSAAETFAVNEIDKTEKVEDLFLARFDNQYAIEVRGKTGEPKPHRPVQLALKHRDFTEPVRVVLQSDASGRVSLGSLEGIDSVTGTAPNGASHTWHLPRDRYTYPATLHGVAGEPLELPYMGTSGKVSPQELSLLEMRGGTFVQNRLEALTIEAGRLRIRDLPRGDYDLLLRDSGHRVRIRLTAGERQHGYAFGASRQLQLPAKPPLQIAAVETDADSLRVRLLNATQHARVHVFATRYAEPFSPFHQLAQVRSAEPLARSTPKPPSLFVAGRNIGDEYRYILDRKYATKFPGNMLERPSLLLNPWAVRSTETGQQVAAEGEQFAPSAEPPASAADRAAAKKEAGVQNSDFSSLDFLADAAVVLLNQSPDEQGVVTIARQDLGWRQQVFVVAVDPVATVYRSVALPEAQAEFVDLRLAKGLDPQAHFTQQKRVTMVAEGGQFIVPDIVTSRFEIYDSLARVHSLYAALNPDPKLAEFRFLLTWPELPVEKKRELYSKYACHELNFFLFKKDPAFFEAAVAPYLRNKYHKTFLDEWLVGAPLDDYLAPWRYARLNVPERVLLSQRLADDRAYTVRHVRELFELLPPNLDRFHHLFSTALLGRALEVGDALGVVELRAQLADGAVRLGEARGVQLQAGAAGRFGLPALGGIVAESLDAEAPPPPAAPAPAEPAARRRAMSEALSMRARERVTEEAAEKDKAAAGYFFAEDQLMRKQVRRLFQPLDKTQEWAENNYYQLPIELQNAELVKVNAFWRDYAQHDPQQPFLPVHLAEASANFTEMMLALALLDLPFASAEHKTQFEGAQLTLTAASGMVVFHEEIRPAQKAADATPILVSQNFFRQDDRYVMVEGQQRDKFVTEEFLVHTVYGCQVVITNPTSSPQKLDVLLQIPVGALPVLNSQATRSVQIDLQPYHTQTLEYHFYFPAPGKYAHYPVHVSRNEQLFAHADPVVLNVVEEPSVVDRMSWEFVSQHGTNEEVLAFLRERNVQHIDLGKIAFRMSDAEFFQSAIELLAKRHAYQHTLWSYAIRHNAVPAIRQFLRHADEFVAQSGAYLDSPLLTVDPVERKAYQHLDYRPLVNARVHQLGQRRQIVNQRLFEQYQRLLNILSYKAELDPDDLMSVTYYLLLQERVAEAQEFFGRVDVQQLESKLQHDYFAAYLALSQDKLPEARKLTDRWLEHPVDRWRNVFAALDQQLKEIAGAATEVVDSQDRGQSQTQLAATEPSFELQLEGKTIRLSYQNLAAVRVDYYLMDIELLFSRNPFVQQYTSQFSSIRPNRSDDIKLPADQRSLDFSLPEEFQNRNVLVQISGSGLSKSQAYYSNAMSLQVLENYGQLRVTRADNGQPLGTVYVKAYARQSDGSIKFYKDGYTDLRGRFDYVSLSTNELENVERFALLVLSDELGAQVREAQPPKR